MGGANRPSTGETKMTNGETKMTKFFQMLARHTDQNGNEFTSYIIVPESRNQITVARKQAGDMGYTAVRVNGLWYSTI